MARPKLGDTETERLHIKIGADELERIEDWRYANRVPSKSEAVRRLVQVGLASTDILPLISKDIYRLMRVYEVSSDTLLEKMQSASTEIDWKALALASIGVMGAMVDEATKASYAVWGLAEKNAAFADNPDVQAAIEAGKRTTEKVQRFHEAVEANDLKTFQDWQEEQQK